MTNSSQTRVAVGAAVLTLAFCLFSPGSAPAQSTKLTATIPFSFYAADMLLPAGQYEVNRIGGAMRLYNRETDTSILFLTNRVDDRTRASSPSFVFSSYGQERFLSQMWWGDGSDGNALPPSRAERQLARAIEPVRIAVAVRH
jgi:hypothetical protein